MLLSQIELRESSDLQLKATGVIELMQSQLDSPAQSQLDSHDDTRSAPPSTATIAHELVQRAVGKHDRHTASRKKSVYLKQRDEDMLARAEKLFQVEQAADRQHNNNLERIGWSLSRSSSPIKQAQSSVFEGLTQSMQSDELCASPPKIPSILGTDGRLNISNVRNILNDKHATFDLEDCDF